MNLHKSLEHRAGFCRIENKYCLLLRGNLILTDERAHFLCILDLFISLRVSGNNNVRFQCSLIPEADPAVVFCFSRLPGNSTRMSFKKKHRQRLAIHRVAVALPHRAVGSLRCVWRGAGCGRGRRKEKLSESRHWRSPEAPKGSELKNGGNVFFPRQQAQNGSCPQLWLQHQPLWGRYPRAALAVGCSRERSCLFGFLQPCNLPWGELPLRRALRAPRAPADLEYVPTLMLQ